MKHFICHKSLSRKTSVEMDNLLICHAVTERDMSQQESGASKIFEGQELIQTCQQFKSRGTADDVLV